MPDAPVLSPDPPLVFRVTGADVVELDLARKLLYHLDLPTRREGDDLYVFRRLADETKNFGFYAQPTDYPTGSQVSCVFVDEGIYSDCLFGDGHIGFSIPWGEVVPMHRLLQVVAMIFVPSYPIEESPYIGRGRSTRWYRAQYGKALTGTPQDSHPGVIFVS